MNYAEFLDGLIVFGLYPPSSGGGSGTVTNVGTGTGLTGGPITTTGVISLAPITSEFLLANLTGGSAAPLPHSMSDILDSVFDNSQGDLLFRNASGWTFLTPGTAGYILQTGGPGADLAWAAAGSGTGTVTSVATGLGLTGGPITSAGTISLANIPVGDLLANIGGFSAAPTGTSVTELFDLVFDSTQGDIIYRNGAEWTFLAPGTVGQLLQTGGAGGDPSWTTGGSGTVTSVATGAGLTGGTITSSGTISLASITNDFILANLSGISAAPSGHSVTDVLDAAFTSTQGAILYRNASQWSYLTPGVAGEFLKTNGPSANPAWAVAETNNWVTIAGTSQAAVAQTDYIPTNVGLTTITLPSIAPVGTLIGVEGYGAGGWRLQAAAGQNFWVYGVVSSTGGTLSSTNLADNAYLVCIVANSTWKVQSTNSQGLSIV